MNYQLHEIVDQKEINYELLQKEGINNTEELLSQAGKVTPRKKLMEKTGLDEEVLLSFIYSADLLRIKGIGKQYVSLLCQADVCTIEDLADWNGETLYTHLETVNEEQDIVQNLPSVDQLNDFVLQAQQLPNAVEEEGAQNNKSWVASNQKGMAVVTTGLLLLLALGVCYYLFKGFRMNKVARHIFGMMKGLGKTAFLSWVMQKTVGTKNRIEEQRPSWLNSKDMAEKLEYLQKKVVSTLQK